MQSTRGAPDFGPPTREGSQEIKGYLVETRQTNAPIGINTSNPNSVRIPIWLEYARPLDEVKSTIRGVRWFLAIGVFLGTLLAFLAALALAKRSLRPITDLTAAARDIARTGDPDRQVPQPRAEDEVAELAATLNEMLGALESSRSETEAALERQRAFVADASHELRTPLTAVLANLELLADELDGEEREAAASALRSSRRMRRLVADLLLLARSDAGQERHLGPVDVGAVAVDAVGEAGALSADHRLEVDAAPGLVVEGARDELHRLVLNLVENAINHTPPGTLITVGVRGEGCRVLVTVAGRRAGRPARAARADLRALRARRRRPRRLDGPGPGDRQGRRRRPRRGRRPRGRRPRARGSSSTSRASTPRIPASPWTTAPPVSRCR